MTPTPTPTVDLDLDRLESAARGELGAKSLGEKFFDVLVPFGHTWANFPDYLKTSYEKHGLAFAASLTHDETANAVTLSLISALRASEAERERLAGWINAKHLAWDLEYSQGAHFVWVVWALKPGVAHLAAICTTEAKADGYMESLPENGGLSYRGSKMWKERVPLNHAFGWKDSVAAMVMTRPSGGDAGGEQGQ